MITKDALLESIIKEGEICKHLFTKIPADSFTYRPTAEQRDMLELLRYISMVAIAPVKAYVDGDWQGARTYGQRSKDMKAEDFPAAIDLQAEELRAIFADLTEEDFLTREIAMHGGTTATLGSAIINTVLKWITAYKMQLFLYLKSIGVQGLNTANLWRGVDFTPQPAPAPAAETADATA